MVNRIQPAHRLLLLAAASLFPCGAFAAPPRPEALANPNITGEKVIAHIRYLASDELQGRATGSSGNNQAGDYIAERFRTVGLKPAGDSGSYFQQFPVITDAELGEGNRVVFRHGTETATLEPGRDFIPLGYSKNATLTAPVVFAGYGISRPDLGYDDYKGLDVKGKVVVVLRHTPDMDDNGKFSENASFTSKTMTARTKGAAGVLFVTGPLGDFPIFFDKDDPKAGDSAQKQRIPFASATSDSGIPLLIVKPQFVEQLLAPAHKNLKDLQVLIAHGATQSFAVPGATVELRTNVARATVQARNVLGMLEGSDPKLRNEVVVIGAHYDHLGLGDEHSLAESREPAIHHGADDNASGTAGVLELAQYLSAHRTQVGRSILFMSFSGEELGLLGSEYWTKKPTIPLSRVVAMLNLDMVGRLRNDTFSVIGEATSGAWKNVLAQADKKYGFHLQTTGDASGPFGGSDQQSFYLKKVPVLFFFTGVHPDYHKPSDTVDKINGDGEARLLQFVADVAERISRLPVRPNYVKIKDTSSSSGPGFNVYLGTIPDYAAQVQGVQLQGVRDGGPAAQAGIKAGDIIVEFAGKTVRNVQEYTQVLSEVKAGVAVPVVVERNGMRVKLMVTPQARKR